MSGLLDPPDASAVLAGFPLETVHACVRAHHVAAAEASFRSDADCSPLETSLIYGAAKLLVDEFAADTDFQELLDSMSRYFGLVATLQYRAWMLREDSQVLNSGWLPGRPRPD